MFRKIHSNRDPNTTIYSELRKEFEVYILRLRRTGKAIVTAHPGTSFATMVMLLIISGVLSFTIMRNHEPLKPLPKPSTTLNQLGNVIQTIRQNLAWKQQIDSLISKKHLNHQDSLTLENELDKLRHFNQNFKP